LSYGCPAAYINKIARRRHALHYGFTRALGAGLPSFSNPRRRRAGAMASGLSAQRT